MNFEAYDLVALTTLKDLGREKNICHAISGLTGETGELAKAFRDAGFSIKAMDRPNLIEELGDKCWYLQLGAKMFGESLGQWIGMFAYPGKAHGSDQTNSLHLGRALFDLFVLASDMEDARKRYEIYGAEFNLEKVKQAMVHFAYKLALVLDIVGATPDEVLEKNIAKLAKRYPEGTFSLERAVNRDLDAERAALEA